MFEAMAAAAVVAPKVQNVFDSMLQGSGAMEPFNLFLERLTDETAAKTADTLAQNLAKMSEEGSFASESIELLSSATQGLVEQANIISDTFTKVLENAGLANTEMLKFAEYMGAAVINPMSMLYPIFDKIMESMEKLSRAQWQTGNISTQNIIEMQIGTLEEAQSISSGAGKLWEMEAFTY